MAVDKVASQKLFVQAKAYFDCTLLNEVGADWLIGVDEVGWGCFAGSIVIGAVAIHRDFYGQILNGEIFEEYPILWEVNDSKAMTASKREKVAKILRTIPASKGKLTGLGYGTVEEINTVGMVAAYKLAFERAVESVTAWLPTGSKQHVLLDGDRPVLSSVKHSTEVKADFKSFAVGCASVYAKYSRDTEMEQLAKAVPSYSFYGWEKNKGYGTPDHIKGLKEYGPCQLHRKLFIKNYVTSSDGMFEDVSISSLSNGTVSG